MSEHNHKLSKRLLSLSESATLEMTRKSRELREKGIDIITLSIGEPDFNTPESVKQAGIKAIENNHTHYPPVPGTNDLRKAIADKLLRDNGLHYKPSQIIVSNGAKQSIMNAFFSILDEGDEVIIPAPFWVSYPEMVKMAGGTPVSIPSTVEQDFKITASELEQAITPRIKAFIFSSPCNPSGSVYEKDELAELAKVFEQHPNIYVFSDEIYEHIRFEGKHASIASFESIKDQVIVINGLSKGFAMTGWRVGYLAAHQDIVTACITIQGQYTSGSCTISQAAALEAVRTVPAESKELKNMLLQFNKRRDLLYNRLKAIEGIIPNKPKGAFYMFPDISYYFGKGANGFTINNSTDLSIYLLEHAHVALVSGDAFGCDNCIRFSYATTEPILEEACNRIEKALKHLK
ncbi:MAG: pyridoxal phosphate-dependent aminotransferase [Bacteroidales bacterium]|jgi:aspartate aminotransferase|nr:pyridoxal phosphate-dependent aminotransferase [Bacteroidales bacterium]